MAIRLKSFRRQLADHFYNISSDSLPGNLFCILATAKAPAVHKLIVSASGLEDVMSRRYGQDRERERDENGRGSR